MKPSHSIKKCPDNTRGNLNQWRLFSMTDFIYIINVSMSNIILLLLQNNTIMLYTAKSDPTHIIVK